MLLHLPVLHPADPNQVLAGVTGAPLTYPEVGATGWAVLPEGYRHVRVGTELGSGPEVWDRARRALRTWVAQRGAGATVHPPGPPEPAADVVVALRLGPIAVLAPCRVVAVCDEPDRSGFTYGTLPGHPERGEEAFAVRRDRDRVRFEIVAFSRPVGWSAWAGPLGRRAQDGVTRRYLRAVAAYAGGPTG